MTGLRLPLTLAGLCGAASVLASGASPKADQAPAPAAVAPAPRGEVNTSWLQRYGYYDAKKGALSLIPPVNVPGRRLLPTGNEDGC